MFDLFEANFTMAAWTTLVGLAGFGISLLFRQYNKSSKLSAEIREPQKLTARVQEPFPNYSSEIEKLLREKQTFHWKLHEQKFIPKEQDLSGQAHDDLVLKYRNKVRFVQLDKKHKALLSKIDDHPIYSEFPGHFDNYFNNGLKTNIRIIVAILDKEIIGALIYLTHWEKQDTISVKQLIVAPLHRYKGIGAGLLKELRSKIGPKCKICLSDSSKYEMKWMDEVYTDSKFWGSTSYSIYMFLKNGQGPYKSAGFYHKLKEREPSIEIQIC